MNPEDTLSAEEVMAVFYRLGSEISRKAKVGKSFYSASDQVHANAREVLVDVLQSKSPEFRAVFSKAMSEWADIGVERELLVKYFGVGESRRAPTNMGTKLLVRVAKGEAGPAERQFIAKFEQVLQSPLASNLSTTPTSKNQ